MKKGIIAVGLLASVAVIPTAAPAKRAAAPALRLERVVMLMRHGIRPPTSATPAPKGYTSDTWPSWSVDYGLLTERGAAGVKLLGAADRQYFDRAGLTKRGCPSITLIASGKQRAIRTAESWATGFMPGCTASVTHPGDNDPDPIFHGFDDAPASFDGQRAYRESLAMAPKGGIDAETRNFRGELTIMARVLGCKLPACPIPTTPTTLTARDHDRPDMKGPLDSGSTISQTFLLEYLEGKQMKDVGWGRITPAEITRLLRFHPLKFKYSNRPAYIAVRAAAPLASEVVKALTDPSGTPVTLLAGHDTNIADMGGFFQLHWAVPSYPADDVPPGSAVGFELLKAANGTRYVRAFYRAQTMDQLRYQRVLTGAQGPFRQYLPIPGCGNAVTATACRLDSFKALVARRAQG
jgi:4-phytase/acid phosphatase